MATFIRVDERAAAVIAAAVGIGTAFMVAPEQTMSLVEQASSALKGVLP